MEAPSWGPVPSTQNPVLSPTPSSTIRFPIRQPAASLATQRNETRLPEFACIRKFQVSLQPRWSAARTSTSTPATNPRTRNPLHDPLLSPFSLPIRPRGGFIALGIFAYLRHHRSSLLCVSQLLDMVEGKNSGRSRGWKAEAAAEDQESQRASLLCHPFSAFSKLQRRRRCCTLLFAVLICNIFSR